MRFVIVTMAILLVSGAFARDRNWSDAASTDEFGYAIDWSTLKGTAGVRRVWMLRDRTIASDQGSWSSIFLLEVDCAEDRVRPLSAFDYSGRDGSGKVVRSYPEPGPWLYVVPGSVNAHLQKLVGKRFRNQFSLCK